MDEMPIPPAADPARDPAPLPASWPVPERATGLRRIPRRALTVSLVTTALVVVGGAVLAGAVVAAPDGNGTPTPAPPGRAAPGPMGQHGAQARMVGPMRALHGEYVVSDGNGGYRTEEMQRGSVTAVNGSTFTVKSEDGYTHDWVTDAATKMGASRPTTSTSAGLTPGQQVMVTGTKDGDTFHAVRVMAMRQFDRGQTAAQQPGGQVQAPYRNGPMKTPYQGGRGQFGHRFGGGGMPGFGARPKGPMAPDGNQPAPAPSPPDAAPTPTQSS
jgi:hypothetical protein